jgi:hypothetical protein
MSKRTYTIHDTVWDRDIPGDRKIGVFSGRPLPSVLSFEYMTTISMGVVAWISTRAKGAPSPSDFKKLCAGGGRSWAVRRSTYG